MLLAFLQADLVARWHWLTSAHVLDATDAGQVTPGPLFTTATFIGVVLGGVPGVIVATVGIFLPSLVFIAISGPLIPRLRKSPLAGAFLDGVTVASLALMAVVTWQLGCAAIFDVTTVLLTILSASLLVRFRVNSAWLVLGGAAIGFMVQVFHVGGSASLIGFTWRRRGHQRQKRTATTTVSPPAYCMKPTSKETDEAMGQRSNRTYRRILASLFPQVAACYGHIQDARLEMESQLRAAVDAKDWEKAAEVSKRLTQFCEIL